MYFNLNDYQIYPTQSEVLIVNTMNIKDFIINVYAYHITRVFEWYFSIYDIFQSGTQTSGWWGAVE